jgi:hypothetical protein
MTDLPIDLDSILAHLVPGLIALAGIAFLSPRIAATLRQLKAEHSGSTLIALMLGALVIGLIVSDIRTATLDQTFRLNLSWIPLFNRPSFEPMPTEPDAVVYDKLIKEGHLNALNAAIHNEQTPYRFHGNVLLAITFVVCSRIIALSRAAARGAVTRRAKRKDIMLAVVLFVLALIVLYPAFRNRYYNYNTAIRAINKA